MHPQQPSDDPNQGGQYPGGPSSGGQYPGGPPSGGQYPGGQNPAAPSSRDQYAQGPEQYGGYPPTAPGAPGADPARMPGTAITVRVLMFIGGAFGLLFGGLMWLTAGMAASGGRAGEEVLRTLEQMGVPMSGAEAGTLFAVMGAIPFVYGLISVALASFMGRRSTVILWSVVVFQGLAALLLVINIISGAFGALVPLAFAILMLVLMLLESTRAYYSRPSAESRVH